MNTLSSEMLCGDAVNSFNGSIDNETGSTDNQTGSLRATTVLLRTTSDQGWTVELHSLTSTQFLS